MRKIACVKRWACIGAVALCASSYPLHAQVAPAHPAVTLGSAKQAPLIPRNDGLAGMAAYAADHRNLTPDQTRIGYELCGGLGHYRPDCPEHTDRARVLKLIRTTRDSLDFSDGLDTPLTKAARRGDAEIVAAVMAKGIAPNMPNGAPRQLDVALNAAVFGIDLAGPDYLSFWSPTQGYLETIRMLLDAGANPQARIPGLSAILAQALAMRTPDEPSRQARIEMVRLLLEHGADPNSVEPAALASLNDDTVAGLMAAHGLELNPAQSTPMLVEAVRVQNPAMVRTALAAGADPNARAADGRRSLLAAADEKSAKLLLAAGANPRVCAETAGSDCGPYGMPLIFRLPRDPELLRLMIAKGANPDATDGQGNTVLAYALGRGIAACAILPDGSRECVDDAPQRTAATLALLQAGADPNRRSQGQLPLMLVADSQHEIITLLLDKGARMENATPQGDRLAPASMAMAMHQPFLAGELVRRSRGKLGADEQWALYAAARDGNIALAEGLAQHGADLDAQAPYGETALHYAAVRGDAVMVKRLLALGAKPDPQTKPVYISRTQESANPVVIVAAYARMKADTAKQNQYRAAGVAPLELNDGLITPLMIAVGSGNEEVARALLEGGARTRLKSQAGITATDLARAGGNSRLVELLAGHE